MTSYYNEIDPYAAQWLRNLIAEGLIAKGDVDERSIKDVRGSDLAGYTQCHFFAGIGGWSYALRLARWPDSEPVWTGSCPCQPLSSAGQRKGHADERHLWPAFHALIAERRPTTVFGEQVASKDGREWLAGVRADLETLGYAIGAADLCAASAGAPHIRRRLYWLADAAGDGQSRANAGSVHSATIAQSKHEKRTDATAIRSKCLRATGGLGDADEGRRDPRAVLGEREAPEEWPGRPIARSGVAHGMGHTIGARLEEWAGERRYDEPQRTTAQRAGADAFWRDAIWLPCLDGKARRVSPSIFPLAHGISARVGKLRGAGDAIVPQVAAAFIECTMIAATAPPQRGTL